MQSKTIRFNEKEVDIIKTALLWYRQQMVAEPLNDIQKKAISAYSVEVGKILSKIGVSVDEVNEVLKG